MFCDSSSCRHEVEVNPQDMILVLTGLDANCYHYVWTCPRCETEHTRFINLELASALTQYTDIQIISFKVAPPDVLQLMAERVGEYVLLREFETEFGDSSMTALEPADETDDEPEAEPRSYRCSHADCRAVLDLEEADYELAFCLMLPDYSFAEVTCQICGLLTQIFPGIDPLTDLPLDALERARKVGSGLVWRV